MLWRKVLEFHGCRDCMLRALRAYQVVSGWWRSRRSLRTIARNAFSASGRGGLCSVLATVGPCVGTGIIAPGLSGGCGVSSVIRLLALGRQTRILSVVRPLPVEKLCQFGQKQRRERHSRDDLPWRNCGPIRMRSSVNSCGERCSTAEFAHLPANSSGSIWICGPCCGCCGPDGSDTVASSRECDPIRQLSVLHATLLAPLVLRLAGTPGEKTHCAPLPRVRRGVYRSCPKPDFTDMCR